MRKNHKMYVVGSSSNSCPAFRFSTSSAPAKGGIPGDAASLLHDLFVSAVPVLSYTSSTFRLIIAYPRAILLNQSGKNLPDLQWKSWYPSSFLLDQKPVSHNENLNIRSFFRVKEKGLNPLLSKYTTSHCSMSTKFDRLLFIFPKSTL